MNVLQAIQYIIRSCDKISADTIQNCWNHTEILSNTFPLDDIYKDDIDNELGKVIEALNLHNRIQVKEFLTIPDEDIVYLIPKDQIISEIARLFKSRLDADYSDEVQSTLVITNPRV
jgi:hypothetical protein